MNKKQTQTNKQKCGKKGGKQILEVDTVNHIEIVRIISVFLYVSYNYDIIFVEFDAFWS